MKMSANMRLFAVLWIGAGVAAAAQTYTAVPISSPSIAFAGTMGLNNKGQVLGDACDIVGGFPNCSGSHRYRAVWSNGVMTPLPIPSGYSYIAITYSYGINNSGVVVGTLQVSGTNTSHVVVWTNGVPAVLPDATNIPGVGGTCSPNPLNPPS